MPKDPHTHVCSGCGAVGSSDSLPQNPTYLHHFTELSPEIVGGKAKPLFPYLHLRCVPEYLEAEPARSLAAYNEKLYALTLDLEDRLRRSLSLTKEGKHA